MDFPHSPHRSTPAELKEQIEAERRQRPFVIYRDGDGTQVIVDLGDAPERLTIGRGATNELALPWDREVSRVHATLERLAGEWTVEDNGSRNGTFLEGERVASRTRLRDGDAMLVGRTTIVFRNPTGRETLRTATSTVRAAPAITEAQRRVLVALCRPYAASSYAAPASNKQIAGELVLGVETIKTHVRALFEAFELGDLPPNEKRPALAQRALDSGLVSPRDLA